MSNNPASTSKRNRRTTAATLLFAAGAIVIGGLGSAVSANAAPTDSYEEARIVNRLPPLVETQTNDPSAVGWFRGSQARTSTSE